MIINKVSVGIRTGIHLIKYIQLKQISGRIEKYINTNPFIIL